MLVCPKCNNQQEDGKFCGVCGEAVVEMSATAAEADNAPVQERVEVEASSTRPMNESNVQQETNEAVNQSAAATETASTQQTTETIKKGLNNYWSYFVHIIKNPSRAFQVGENQFVNSLITIGLYAVLFALSIFFLLNSLTSSLFGSVGASVPFFSVVSRLIIVIAVLLIITFGSAFLMSKVAKNQDNFKSIIAQYGSLLVPFTALNLVAMIGGIIGSTMLTGFALSLSIFLTFAFIPVLFVYEKVSEINRNGQKVYISLATILLIVLILSLLGDALIVNMLDEMQNLDRIFW